MTLPVLLGNLYPSGLLGIGITALVASFMSGMAGNVTAFNSVWTYDIYQAYFRKKATDQHYLRVGKLSTLLSILLSIAIAYVARTYNNIMDLLQLVFGFVNAPLFATFLLGMFWKRATGHGAFWGLVAGTLTAAGFHGLTSAEGKGSWLTATPWIEFRSGMGQAFDIAIAAFATCFTVTILVSLFTKPKSDEAMRGLVYSLTDRQKDSAIPWYARPMPLALTVLVAVVFLNYALR
jgi:SSS family solute:Na+ symporter